MAEVVSKTRVLTETAFLVALSGVLFLFAQVPWVGPILCLVCPFPLTIMAYRHGARPTVVGVASLAVVLGLTQGALALFAVPFVWIGVLAGGLLRLRRGALDTVAAGAFGMAALVFVAVWGYENRLAQAWGHVPLHARMEAKLDKLMEDGVPQLAKFYGVSLDEFKKSEAYAQQVRNHKAITYRLKATAWMPLGLAVAMGGAAFLFYFLAAGPVLSRFEVEIPEFPPFREWSSPWVLAWVAIAVLGLGLAPELVKSLEPSERIPYLAFFLLDLTIVLEGFYALMGAAVLDDLLQRAGLPWIVARPLELLMMIGGIPGGPRGLTILAFVGIVDPWLQLRRRLDPPASDAKGTGDDDGIDLDLPF